MTTLTESAVHAAITRFVGNLSLVAEALGVTRDDVVAFVTPRPALRGLVEDMRESLLDLAETKLRAAIAKQEPWAIEFILQTLGRRYGYGDDTPPLDEPDQMQFPPKFHRVPGLIPFLRAFERERKSREMQARLS